MNSYGNNPMSVSSVSSNAHIETEGNSQDDKKKWEAYSKSFSNKLKILGSYRLENKSTVTRASRQAHNRLSISQANAEKYHLSVPSSPSHS